MSRSPALSLRHERMSPAFAKQHFAGLPVPAALHHFTAPEPHADPHDHPFSFTSFVISGGYIEEVFHPLGNGWRSELITRLPGTSHHVEATHIHRIVALPAGECWTLVTPGPHERTTRFLRFGDGVMSRAWDRRKWVRE